MAATSSEVEAAEKVYRLAENRCPHCGCSFVTLVSDDVSGVNCLDCNHWVSMSSQSSTTAGPAPPPPSPPPQSSKFPCPGHCSICRKKFTATVSIGKYFILCVGCYNLSFVDVKSPYFATSEKAN